MTQISTSIRLRAHQANIERYRRLLTGRLSRVEREYVMRRIAEERAEMKRLLQASANDCQPDASDMVAERERYAAALRWEQRL